MSRLGTEKSGDWPLEERIKEIGFRNMFHGELGRTRFGRRTGREGQVWWDQRAAFSACEEEEGVKVGAEE